ncbi:MAG: hypothetical protein Q9221_004540 [Calogaya cf. arnoldii]
MAEEDDYMDENNDDMPTEEAMAYLKEELERSKFWSAFMREFEKSPMEALEDFQKTMQSKDDEERKAKGLEPRAWSEIAMDIQEMSDLVLEQLEEDEREWDAKERKAQRLEPRSDEELEADLGPGLGHRIDQIQDLVMKYDEQERKEKGLQPRSWKEFQEEFEEAVEQLSKDGNDGKVLRLSGWYNFLVELRAGRGEGIPGLPSMRWLSMLYIRDIIEHNSMQCKAMATLF